MTDPAERDLIESDYVNKMEAEIEKAEHRREEKLMNQQEVIEEELQLNLKLRT